MTLNAQRPGTPRDSQRSRVYAAERVLWEYHVPKCRNPWRASRRQNVTTGGRLDTIEEMQTWVNRITRSAWYRRAFPQARTYIEVAHGGGCGSARASGSYRIEMPEWSRCKLVVLHELAHCIQTRTHPRGEAWHGRAFCRIYLALVQRWLGADMAKRLRAAFRAHRVRWHPSRPGPVGGGNPEALRAWREQRAAAAARCSQASLTD